MPNKLTRRIMLAMGCSWSWAWISSSTWGALPPVFSATALPPAWWPSGKGSSALSWSLSRSDRAFTGTRRLVWKAHLQRHERAQCALITSTRDDRASDGKDQTTRGSDADGQTVSNRRRRSAVDDGPAVMHSDLCCVYPHVPSVRRRTRIAATVVSSWYTVFLYQFCTSCKLKTPLNSQESRRTEPYGNPWKNRLFDRRSSGFAGSSRQRRSNDELERCSQFSLRSQQLARVRNGVEQFWSSCENISSTLADHP
jgi:ribosomal protein L44E